jgi:DNA-binding beta-propeller fold protein YncE
VALDAGHDARRRAAALGEIGIVSARRMDVFDRPDGVTVIDDSYNANPSSTAAALRALAAIGRGRRTSRCSATWPSSASYERRGTRRSAGSPPSSASTGSIAVGERRADPDGAAAVPAGGQAIVAADQAEAIAVLDLRRATWCWSRVAVSHVGGRGQPRPEGRQPVRAVIVAAAVAFIISLFGTPIAIRVFTALKAGSRSGASARPPTRARRARRRWVGWRSSSPPCWRTWPGTVALTTLPSAQIAQVGPR